jgi:spermidine/putrescine transport system ATP-binding protein
MRSAGISAGGRNSILEPILELRDLVKQYPGQRAVDGVSLAIPRGGFYTLVGPSGCGKTSTLRMIAGFEEPTSGDVLLNGQKVNHLKPYERNVSTVFQSYALFPHLTARHNVEFGLRRAGKTNIADEVQHALELVRLTGKEDRFPAQLSGGEGQRVALARSLVLQPDVLLLDEPMAALDPKLRKQMRHELTEMQRRVGITFLMVTHDQEEALAMSDQIAVMNEGRVEQVGPPREIYLRPRTRYVADFLGAVNWFGEVGVRPEATQIRRSSERRNSVERQTNDVSGSVERTTFLGDCVQVLVRLSSGSQAVAQFHASNSSFECGETVYLYWDSQDEMRFS